MSESLSSLFTKEQIALKNERFVQLLLYFSFVFLTAFLLFMPKSESLPSLFAPSIFFKEPQEPFALVTLHKRATIRELLLSLFTKEQPRAICSCCSLQKSHGSDSLFSRAIALSLTKNERFARKTKEQIPNPAKKGFCKLLQN